MKKSGRESLALWLEKLPGRSAIPFNVNRRTLYRVADLYKGYKPGKPETWKAAFDHRVYGWTLDPRTTMPRQLKVEEVIAERLHDTAIGQCITRHLRGASKNSGKPVVGFMGGHEVDRDDPKFEQIARIARDLRRLNFTIVSGGGPGLMEAANFGAFVAPYGEKQFTDALSVLKKFPSASDKEQWVGSAVRVRSTLLSTWKARELPGSESLGIPTWYYGNEPPNLFASHTGKYFFNSVREDGLVSIANGGIVFGPGSAGTVQEVFQDTTLNFYRNAGTPATPMVLLGVDFWNSLPASPPHQYDKPVFPLLSALAKQTKANFAAALLLTDDENDIVKFISSFQSKTASPDHAAPRHHRFKGRALASL